MIRLARGFLGVLLVPAVLAPVVLAQGPEQNDVIFRYRGADRVPRLVERAKREGSVVLYTSLSPTESQPLAAAFEKKYGIKLGFMSFFVKAAAVALREQPAVNAEIDGTDIVYKDYFNIGVAVGAPSGLVVPVLRDADAMSFAQVEGTISEFGVKAREGKLTLADMTGGTFTISNGGIFGSLLSTPILNAPQSAILGMHAIQQRPMVVGDAIEARPMMYLALSYDHRIIDGREAVTFLVRIKQCIEDPQRILLDI